MHEFLEVSGVVFRSDIGTSVVFSHPSDEDLREIFFGYLEVDVTVVSFEETIIFWIVGLDEIVFEIEGFGFCPDFDKIDTMSFGQHILFSY